MPYEKFTDVKVEDYRDRTEISAKRSGMDKRVTLTIIPNTGMHALSLEAFELRQYVDQKTLIEAYSRRHLKEKP
ncbi:MAG: hypothetical protein F4Y39_18380 [Gemmatimonadetes bacterium]|nr:hypothetical protein [Gemmatimonadota bacterium]MYF72543.1 hypothetical protein [Gemmatimonadota bacterium]MYK52991.1 hypothetical protein [Gemmatimonadota bacterium]